MSKKTNTDHEKKAVGRPRKGVDWKIFDKLCYLQSTLEEIALFFECDVNTIEAIVKREQNQGFSEYVKKKRVFGKIDLRGWQMTSARKGSAAMQRWCGIQYLGQSERIESKNEHTGADGGAIVVKTILSADERAENALSMLIEDSEKELSREATEPDPILDTKAQKGGVNNPSDALPLSDR